MCTLSTSLNAALAAFQARAAAICAAGPNPGRRAALAIYTAATGERTFELESLDAQGTCWFTAFGNDEESVLKEFARLSGVAWPLADFCAQCEAQRAGLAGMHRQPLAA